MLRTASERLWRERQRRTGGQYFVSILSIRFTPLSRRFEIVLFLRQDFGGIPSRDTSTGYYRYPVPAYVSQWCWNGSYPICSPLSLLHLVLAAPLIAMPLPSSLNLLRSAHFTFNLIYRRSPLTFQRSPVGPFQRLNGRASVQADRRSTVEVRPPRFSLLKFACWSSHAVALPLNWSTVMHTVCSFFEWTVDFPILWTFLRRMQIEHTTLFLMSISFFQQYWKIYYWHAEEHPNQLRRALQAMLFRFACPGPSSGVRV